MTDSVEDASQLKFHAVNIFMQMALQVVLPGVYAGGDGAYLHRQR